MLKIDYKKEFKDLYGPRKPVWETVVVPPMNFLMVDGRGDPNVSHDYNEAVKALYAVSYALKFTSKQRQQKDYVVMPLEGLWESYPPHAKADFKWTMMVMQPDWIGANMVEAVIEAVKKKKGLPALSKLYFREYVEGLSLQKLHIGPYDDEGPVLAHLHTVFMPANGLDFNGIHHEIYLSDPRKTDPSKLRTILRQPVKPVRP